MQTLLLSLQPNSLADLSAGLAAAAAAAWPYLQTVFGPSHLLCAELRQGALPVSTLFRCQERCEEAQMNQMLLLKM